MKKLIAVLLLSVSAFGTVVTGVNNIKTAGGLSFTGSIVLGLNVAGAQDTCLTRAIVQGPVTIKVMNGSVVGAPFISGNDCIAPQGTVYLASWRDPYGNERMSNVYSITGSTFDLGAAVPLPLTTSNVSAMDLLGIRTLTVTGNGGITNAGNFINTALGLVTWGSSGTASIDTGISRCGVATLCFGNGTQGDTSGSLKLTTFAPTSVITGQIIQPAATIATWKDNTGGTRASIPSNGTSQGTLNNWNLTGGSSISGTAVGGATGTGNVVFDISATITTPTIARETINTGISQGSGLKHQRFGATNATAAAAGATSITTYTWTSAFADANYTVTCTGTAQANTPAGPVVESVTASNFVVRVTAITAAAGSFGGVDCIAIHD